VLLLLGIDPPVVPDSRAFDGLGVGCHPFNGSPYWLVDPDFYPLSNLHRSAWRVDAPRERRLDDVRLQPLLNPEARQ
jgi:hypothetical protein